jgi:hypothetical protein
LSVGYLVDIFYIFYIHIYCSEKVGLSPPSNKNLYQNFVKFKYIQQLMFKFYKLREWVDPSKLDWSYLSLNPNAIYLLENKIN